MNTSDERRVYKRYPSQLKARIGLHVTRDHYTPFSHESVIHDISYGGMKLITDDIGDENREMLRSYMKMVRITFVPPYTNTAYTLYGSICWVRSAEDEEGSTIIGINFDINSDSDKYVIDLCLDFMEKKERKQRSEESE